VTKLGKNEMKLLKNWKSFRKVCKHFSGITINITFGVMLILGLVADALIIQSRTQKLPSYLFKKCPGICDFKEME
jgi:hypothetical protein